MGINVENITDSQGNLLPSKDIIEKSIRSLNSNPSFMIPSLKRSDFLIFKSGRLISKDMKLQSWYANTIRHLDSNNE